MNLKEYAESKGISLAEAKTETGLTHWKQEVPDAVQEQKAGTLSPCEASKDSQEVAEEIRKPAEEEIPLKAIELSIRTLGNKSPYWNKRHLIG